MSENSEVFSGVQKNLDLDGNSAESKGVQCSLCVRDTDDVN